MQGAKKNRIQEVAGEKASEYQEKAVDSANQAKSNLSERVDKINSALRRTSEELRNQNESGIAEYVDDLCHGIDSVNQKIRQKDPRQVIQDVQSFGKRNPGALIGGAVLLGLVASRIARGVGESYSSSSVGTEGIEGQPLTRETPFQNDIPAHSTDSESNQRSLSGDSF